MKILLNIIYGGSGYSELISETLGRTVKHPIINQDAEDIWNWYVDNADITTNDATILNGRYHTKGDFVYHFKSDDEEIMCVQRDKGGGWGPEEYEFVLSEVDIEKLWTVTEYDGLESIRYFIIGENNQLVETTN